MYSGPVAQNWLQLARLTGQAQYVWSTARQLLAKGRLLAGVPLKHSLCFAALLLASLQAIGASERVLQHLSDEPAAQIAPGIIPAGGAFSGEVELRGVAYTYPNRPDAPALSGVDLWLQPGKLTALVGLSGSGKSTLVSVLQRLYDPTGGGPVKQLGSWLSACSNDQELKKVKASCHADAMCRLLRLHVIVAGHKRWALLWNCPFSCTWFLGCVDFTLALASSSHPPWPVPAFASCRGPGIDRWH